MDNVARSEKVAFYGVKSVDTVTYTRMQGFTDMTKNANAKEYSRQYVDEPTERVDVTGYAPSIAYTFDRIKGNAVHEDIISVTDGEKIGADAIRSIILVDLTTGTEDETPSYKGIKRDYSIIPSNEGGGTDSYTYSGDFKANGEKVEVNGTLSADGLTFTPVP